MPPRKPYRPTVTAYPDRLRECPVCHVWFAPIRDAKRYCSHMCGEAARKARAAVGEG